MSLNSFNIIHNSRSLGEFIIFASFISRLSDEIDKLFFSSVLLTFLSVFIELSSKENLFNQDITKKKG